MDDERANFSGDLLDQLSSYLAQFIKLNTLGITLCQTNQSEKKKESKHKSKNYYFEGQKINLPIHEVKRNLTGTLYIEAIDLQNKKEIIDPNTEQPIRTKVFSNKNEAKRYANANVTITTCGENEYFFENNCDRAVASGTEIHRIRRVYSIITIDPQTKKPIIDPNTGQSARTFVITRRAREQRYQKEKYTSPDINLSNHRRKEFLQLQIQSMTDNQSSHQTQQSSYCTHYDENNNPQNLQQNPLPQSQYKTGVPQQTFQEDIYNHDLMNYCPQIQPTEFDNTLTDTNFTTHDGSNSECIKSLRDALIGMGHEAKQEFTKLYAIINNVDDNDLDEVSITFLNRAKGYIQNKFVTLIGLDYQYCCDNKDVINVIDKFIYEDKTLLNWYNKTCDELDEHRRLRKQNKTSTSNLHLDTNSSDFRAQPEVYNHWHNLPMIWSDQTQLTTLYNQNQNSTTRQNQRQQSEHPRTPYDFEWFS